MNRSNWKRVYRDMRLGRINCGDTLRCFGISIGMSPGHLQYRTIYRLRNATRFMCEKFLLNVLIEKRHAMTRPQYRAILNAMKEM